MSPSLNPAAISITLLAPTAVSVSTSFIVRVIFPPAVPSTGEPLVVDGSSLLIAKPDRVAVLAVVVTLPKYTLDTAAQAKLAGIMTVTAIRASAPFMSFLFKLIADTPRIMYLWLGIVQSSKQPHELASRISHGTIGSVQVEGA
ncbi:MAG: hypothetical protein LBL73_11700, partial [Synergistaceae bacterium]|nr:hypothetical protein [Synergistaceae bacterium]